MYLLPWQIFVLGCICGIFITFFVATVIIFRLAFRGGVKVEKIEDKKEEKTDGEL